MGRCLARVFAVLALGTGVGCLVWGITSAALGEPVRTPLVFGVPISNSSEVMGAGAGLIVAGVTALILSLVGGRRNGDRDKGDRDKGPGCC